MSKETTFLQTPSAPSLPVATTQYTQRFQDQYSNVLRLYFNQISGVLSSLTGENGGQYVDCPNGLFFNTQDQTFAAINTEYPVVFDNTYLHSAVALKDGSTSQIQVTVPGIYNFQYTGQVISTNTSAKTIYLWIKRNNVTIGYSTRATTININNGYVPITWSFDIDLDVDEYIELQAAVTDTAMKLDAVASTSPHSGIPSSVMSVNYVAPLPATRPSPP